MGKSKSYYTKKNKDNYELTKKLSKDYQLEKITGKTFSQYKKEHKKHLGK